MSVLYFEANYTNQATTVFLNILRGGSNNAGYDVAYIDVGTGGDFWAGVDTGARVAPDPTETEIRVRIFRANIVYSQVTTEGHIVYTAGVEPFECVSTEINEFSLVSTNGTMIAHYVTPEVAGPGSRATDLTKTTFVQWALNWRIKLLLTT